jgi:uncharacterized protein
MTDDLLDALDLDLWTRAFAVDLAVRSIDQGGDGRTLVGRAVPYGETTTVTERGRTYQERFVLGAFARQIAGAHPGAVKIFESHRARLDGAAPIGKTAALVERPDGLHGAWPLFATARANDALELVRSGEVTGLSVGCKLTAEGSRRARDGVVERIAVHLDHVVLTHEPVYAGAGVTGVRSVEPPAPGRPQTWRLDLERLRTRARVR